MFESQVSLWVKGNDYGQIVLDWVSSTPAFTVWPGYNASGFYRDFYNLELISSKYDVLKVDTVEFYEEEPILFPASI